MRRNGLYALAVFLLIIGGIAFFAGSNVPAIRPIAIGACLVSVYLIRLSGARGRSELRMDEVGSSASKSPNRSLWFASAASLLAGVVAFLCLMNDAAHGYHQVWPVYFFAGVACICIVVWSHLVASTR